MKNKIIMSMVKILYFFLIQYYMNKLNNIGKL